MRNVHVVQRVQAYLCGGNDCRGIYYYHYYYYYYAINLRRVPLIFRDEIYYVQIIYAARELDEFVHNLRRPRAHDTIHNYYYYISILL